MGSPPSAGDSGAVDSTGDKPRVWLRLGRDIVSATDRQPSFAAWTFIGADAERYFAVQRALAGQGREIAFGPLLNAAVDEFQDEIVNFEHVLEITDEAHWQATDTAERSVYTGSYIHGCASSLALARLLAELDETLLVVVDDVFLARRLESLARSLGRDGDRLAIGAYVGARAVQLGLGVAHRAYFLGAFAARRAKLRRLAPARPFGPPVDCLIVTWADPETFDPAQPIRSETYFGGASGVLRDRGLRLGYLAVPAAWMYPIESILANIAAAHDPVVELEQVVSWREVGSIVLRSLVRPVRIRGPLVVDGIDVTGQLVDELRSEWAKSRRLWAMQFFHAGRRLAEVASPGRVLHLYEGQPWEKLLRLGIREAAPQTELVGVQHTPMSKHWFPLFPSRRELASGRLPDRLITLGTFWRSLFAEHGYPSERLGVGPALRYSYLHDAQPAARTGSGRTVLVAGAMEHSETLELVVKAIRAVEALKHVQLRVKLHPKMAGGRERFLALLHRVAGCEALPEWLGFVDGSISDALAGADVVLYTTTSVSYEALAAGVPVVCVNSSFWFDLDPVPAAAGVTHAARTPDELAAVVDELLAAGPPSEAELERWCAFLADTLAVGDAASFTTALFEAGVPVPQ